jgi:NitT/TauT family transport system ATP-binding protein
LYIQILQGEIVTILGMSGCGKSTLLNLIAGFRNLYGGKFYVMENSVRDISFERIICFKDLNFFPSLVVLLF